MFLEKKPRFRTTKKTTEIGTFIKQKRMKLRITQADLAKRVGLGYDFIREVEQGKKTVRLDKLNLLLDFFGFEIGIKEKKRELFNLLDEQD